MSTISDALVPGFSGRIPRRTYWLAVVACLVLTNVLPLAVYQLFPNSVFWYSELGAGVCAVYLVGCYLVFFSALVRRLHDIGRSGAWALIFFLPLIGQLFAFILGCLSSADGANRYGLNPDAPDRDVLELGRPATADDTVAALERLEHLLEKNLITREEFDRQKARLLGESSGSGAA